MHRCSLSRRRASAGTYVAEQSRNNCYELIAAPLAQLPAPICGPPSSARGVNRWKRPFAPGRPVKYTHLSALDCLEPILSNEPAPCIGPSHDAFGRMTSSGSPDAIFKEPPLTARASTSNSHQTSRASSANSSLTSRTLQISKEFTDEEFRSFLVPIGTGKKSSSSRRSTHSHSKEVSSKVQASHKRCLRAEVIAEDSLPRADSGKDGTNGTTGVYKDSITTEAVSEVIVSSEKLETAWDTRHSMPPSSLLQPRKPSKDSMRKNSARHVAPRRRLSAMDTLMEVAEKDVRDIACNIISANPVEVIFRDEDDDITGDKRRARLLYDAANFIAPRRSRDLRHALTTGAGEPHSLANESETEEEATGDQPVSSRRLSLKQLIRKHTAPALDGDLMQGHGQSGLSSLASGNLWGQVLEASQQQVDASKLPIEPGKKDACILLRFFVFGMTDSRKADTPPEPDAMFDEHIGTREQVYSLCNLWLQLDADLSGRVDITEFRAFASHHLQDKVSVGVPCRLRWLRSLWNEDRDKVVAKIVEKLESHLLCKKSSFTIEDMMRLIWLRAQHTDLKTMNVWYQELLEERARARVDSPPALNREEFDDLCMVFRYYDDAGHGEISFEDLVSKGLVYPDDIQRCKNEWDSDGNGKLDMLEFCEMMCPVGHRASQESRIGTQKDGKRVIFDNRINGWRLEKLPAAHAKWQTC